MGNIKTRSQINLDKHILNFVEDMEVETPEDLVKIRNYMLDTLIHKDYIESKVEADSIQWKRTASQIIQDGYVYEGKACSDLAVVFLALCKAKEISGCFLKLISIDEKQTHTIVEVQLNEVWYRLDPSTRQSIPYPKRMTRDDTFRGKYKLWKKGRDLWDIGLNDANAKP